jgi:hypothetical protein
MNAVPDRYALLEGNHAELADRLREIAGFTPLAEVSHTATRSWRRWANGENGGPDHEALRRLMVAAGRSRQIPALVGRAILESLAMGTMHRVVEAESRLSEAELDLTGDGRVNHHDRLLALSLAADCIVGMAVRLQQSMCKRMHGETLGVVREVRSMMDTIEQQVSHEMNNHRKR